MTVGAFEHYLRVCVCVCVCVAYKSSRKLKKQKCGKLILLPEQGLLPVIKCPVSIRSLCWGAFSNTQSLFFLPWFSLFVSVAKLSSLHATQIIFPPWCETPNHCLSHTFDHDWQLTCAFWSCLSWSMYSPSYYGCSLGNLQVFAAKANKIAVKKCPVARSSLSGVANSLT